MRLFELDFRTVVLILGSTHSIISATVHTSMMEHNLLSYCYTATALKAIFINRFRVQHLIIGRRNDEMIFRKCVSFKLKGININYLLCNIDLGITSNINDLLCNIDLDI